MQLRYEIKLGGCVAIPIPIHIDTVDVPVNELEKHLVQQGLVNEHDIIVDIGVCLDLPGD